MKKVAIGCGIVLVVALIAAAVGAYFVVNKVRSTVAGFSELGKVPDLERQVRNRSAFVAPSSGELTADQIATYVAVREQVRQKMGERFKQIDTKYKSLMERVNRDQHTALDVPQLISVYQELAGLYVLGKQAQVDALNAKNLSLGEYRWIQVQAYTAIGIPVMNMDVSRFIDDLKAGRTPEQPGQLTLPGPSAASDKNKALVEPHKKLLEDNASLSFFGL
jgi:hypothetical protein